MLFQIVVEKERCLIVPPYLGKEPQNGKKKGVAYHYAPVGIFFQFLGCAFELKSTDGKIFYINRSDLNEWLRPHGYHAHNQRTAEEAIQKVVNQATSDYWKKIGDDYRENGKPEKASSAFDEALKFNSQNLTALVGRAACLRQKEKFIEAIADCNRVIGINPSYSFAWSCKGDCERMLEDYENAIKNLEKAIALNPVDDFAWASKGDCYLQQGNEEKALEDFTKALEIRPDNQFAKAGLCDCYIAMSQSALQHQQYDRAISLVNKALEFDKTYSLAQAALGKVYKVRAENWVVQLEFEKAVLEFSKAIEIQLTDSEAFAQRGACFLALGQIDKALEDLKKAIEINAHNEFAKTLLSDFLKEESVKLLSEKKMETAIDLLTQYLKIKPEDHTIWIRRGECFHALCKFEEEKQNFDESIKFNPDQLDLRLRRGLCAFRMKDYEEAMANFSFVSEKDPANVLAWLFNGQVSQAQGELEQAVKCFSKAIEVDPKQIIAYHQRALANYAMKKYGKALADCTVALDLDPNDRYAQEIRSKVLYGQSVPNSFLRRFIYFGY